LGRLGTGHPRSPHGTLPDLIFPADRSWLVSALWDDTWTCIGGPRHLIDALAADILMEAHPELFAGVCDAMTDVALNKYAT